VVGVNNEKEATLCLGYSEIDDPVVNYKNYNSNPISWAVVSQSIETVLKILNKYGH